MKLDLFILYISSLINLALGAVVFLRNTKSLAGRSFLGLALSLTAWTITNYYTDNATVFALNVWADRLAFAFGFLTLVATAAFTFYFGSRRLLSKRQWLFYPPVVIAITGLSMSNFTARSLTPIPGGYGVVPGSLYLAYPLFLLTFFAISLRNLYTTYKTTHNDVVKTQIKFIVFGFSVTFVLGVLTNVIAPALTGNWEVAKVGPLLTVFMVGSLTYAIVKHRLFNVRLVIARSIAYVLLLATLAGLYGAAIFSLSRYVFPHNITLTAQNTFYVVLAVLLAFSFQPLRRFFERLTDSIFFRDNYDSQQFLNDFGHILVSEFRLEPLLQKTLADICSKLKIVTGQLYIFSDQRIYKVEHYGAIPSRLITAPHLQALHHRLIVADELTEGKEKTIMENFGFRVVLHLRTQKEFVGYLLLGDKLSGTIYTAQDIKVLEILSQELAVAISNAKAYAEIAQFNVTLQEKIDDATKQLQSANRHLKELDHAKDEFISMVSHQLRTPLAGISSYLSMVLEGDTGKVNHQQAEFLGHAYINSQRMVAMISDLLNISRMSAGRFKIETCPVDLRAMVKEEVQQLQQSAREKGLRLRFVAPKQAVPMLELDEDKTRQVVMNFIDNAIYYTQKGEIVVSLDVADGRVELRVKDSGIGVPKAAQRHLFGKFYRADNAKGVRPNGTGLGLFLAKRVIEDQGGVVIFESVEGQGSTFGFAMPIKKGRPTGRRTVAHGAR